MSLTLLILCRPVITRSSLLRPIQLSSRIFLAESSTLKSKYSSLKPSPSYQNPFREPTDEKSRRLKLQEQIRFREKFQLEKDYELVYAMPRQKMYSLMHLLCTTATVTMFVFILLQFHRDMLDMEPVLTEMNPQVPLWAIYSVATVVGTAFGAVLVLIARMPVRLYYSPVRHSYALFYHPVIGVLRQKKILFRDNQYTIIPQKLDEIQSAERSVQIRIDIGQGLLGLKKSFYLIETLFRSKRDIQRLRKIDTENEQIKTKETTQTQEEADIWETVVEKKEQQQQQVKKRTFM